MRLHANAPLGPKGRATMVRRVVAADWSLTQAAEAAGVSESAPPESFRNVVGAGRRGSSLGLARSPAAA